MAKAECIECGGKTTDLEEHRCMYCRFMHDNVTHARIDKLSECPRHPGRIAWYDFRTYMGPWMFGCYSCWIELRMYKELGTGKGQKLVLAQVASVK